MYSSPAKSSKSQPLEIVSTRAAPSARSSSAIGSETATTASALRATSRATLSPVRSLARTSALSVRRCGFATIESRRSAIQRAPVARRTAAPTRWTDVGGEVVSTTSIFSRLTMRIAAGIAVRFQVTFSSGARALRKVSPALRAARSIPVTPCSSSAGRRPLGPR